jgi:Hemerythrin HHE cation binding domain
MTHLTEQLASKAMGAIKAAKATLVGLTGVFKKLEQEHGEVSALLLRVKMSSDVGIRRELFPKIRAELLAHEKGELRHVYPMFRTHPATQHIAEHHDQEAMQLHDTLEQLARMDITSEGWKTTFDRMVEMVQHHVKEEETEYFPAGQKAFADRTEEMLKAYLRTKREMLTALTDNTPVHH